MTVIRILLVLLSLSQISAAEDDLTADQVIQRWVKEQREHPVSQVKVSWIERDQTFRYQTIRLCEVTYASETSGQIRIIPWPSTMKPPSVGRGYELRENESIFDMSWNESTVFFHDNDGTVHEFPRPGQIFPSFAVMDFVEKGLPPVFPGPVNESRIAKFDWSIMKRETNSIWLSGIPKAKKEKGSYDPAWEEVIDTSTWQVRAARRFDNSGNKETVMLVRRD